MASIPFAPAPLPSAPSQSQSAGLPSGELSPDLHECPHTLPALLAPRSQLSGDGQLRELMQERRDRRREAAAIWYLPPGLLEQLAPAEAGGGGQEAVVASDPAVVTWLQLRFGGHAATLRIAPPLLEARARALPPPAVPAPLGHDRGHD